MVKFNVFTEKVVIDGEEYLINPLPGKYIGKLFFIVQKLMSGKKKVEDISTDEMIALLDEEVMSTLHDMAVVTIKSAYPEIPQPQLESWVSQNLLVLLVPIIKVNIQNKQLQNQIVQA